MLSLWRRHEAKCPHKLKGRSWIKCPCPIWYDGEIDGKRVRRSLETRDWARATRKLGAIEDPSINLRPCAQPGCYNLVEAGTRCEQHSRTVDRAITAFHDAHQDVSLSTKLNYRRVLRLLGEFTAARDIATMDRIDLETLNAFRASRNVNLRTWTKELGTIRQFFRHCLDNEWIHRNWAEKVPMPKNLKPAAREPYTPNEIARIVAACDAMGRSAYERLRARAMILLLRYTALRISDVATLVKDRIRNGEIFVRTSKNGKPVRLPVHPDLQAALDILPLPRGAHGSECLYFFWSGHGSRSAVIRDATRTLGAVYSLSGVPGACSHRFRHTLATEILELGGTFEEAADILGDTEAIIRKHYAKWSAGRQARITGVLKRLWHVYGTQKTSDSQAIPNEWDSVVDLVRFELTTSSMPWKHSYERVG
jgi:site-specific recombinase XerD